MEGQRAQWVWVEPRPPSAFWCEKLQSISGLSFLYFSTDRSVRFQVVTMPIRLCTSGGCIPSSASCIRHWSRRKTRVIATAI